MPSTDFLFAQLVFMSIQISAPTLAAQSFHCLFKLVILPITDPARLHLLGKHIGVTDKSAFLFHTSLESVMSFRFLSIRSVFQGKNVTAEKRLLNSKSWGTGELRRWSVGARLLVALNSCPEMIPWRISLANRGRSFRGSQAWCVLLQMELQVPPAERTTDTSRGFERRESLSVRADTGDKVSVFLPVGVRIED